MRSPLRSALCACLVLAAGCGKKPAPPEPVPGDAAGQPPEGAPAATPPPAVAPGVAYPFRRAVVLSIGINKYPQLAKAADLKYAEADARGISEVLATRYGFEVVSLYNEAASKRAVEAALAKLGAELGDSDVLVIYFAGHGQVIPANDGGETGYLLPADAELDLTVVSNPEQWAAEALDMRWLTAAANNMRARHVLLVADACCSGFLTARGALARADLKSFLFDRSRAVLAATTKRQKAREDAATGHGYFTAALLDELRKDDAASVIDLHAPILHRVARETNGTMTPQLASVGDGDGTFVFIPKSIPRSEIEADLDGRMLSTEKPKGLARVLARQRDRVALQTTPEQFFETLIAVPYAHSPRAEELRQMWERRFARFKENAAAGDPWALAAVSVCSSEGLGSPRNPESAYSAARQLDRNVALPGLGRYLLGRCLSRGDGVEKNLPGAERLFRESAEAKFILGELTAVETALKKSTRTEAEVAQVREVLERGVKQKIPNAALNLAAMFASGVHPGMKQDLRRAVELYEAAAGWHSAPAMVELYKWYGAERPGVLEDGAKAEAHLRRAADLGWAHAQFLLAREYLPPTSDRKLNLVPADAEVFRWMTLAAEAGFGPAQAGLARCYFDGAGTSRNLEVAKMWCERAAAQNDPDGFFLQGSWYQSGAVYGRRDLRSASERFKRAADLGHVGACKNLIRIFEERDDSNWMDLLHYTALAERCGAIDRREATLRIGVFYKKYIKPFDREPRWEKFAQAHPDTAELVRDLIEQKPTNPKK